MILLSTSAMRPAARHDNWHLLKAAEWVLGFLLCEPNAVLSVLATGSFLVQRQVWLLPVW